MDADKIVGFVPVFPQAGFPAFLLPFGKLGKNIGRPIGVMRKTYNHEVASVTCYDNTKSAELHDE
jgi:hypothetical protein